VKERGIFGRVRIQRVGHVSTLARYFVKTFKVGAVRASGYPVTFSKNVVKRKWWEEKKQSTLMKETIEACDRWVAWAIESGALAVALDRLRAESATQVATVIVWRAAGSPTGICIRGRSGGP
jgi:hypothetical protein